MAVSLRGVRRAILAAVLAVPMAAAARLALFSLSPEGQAILARHGFAPVTNA